MSAEPEPFVKPSDGPHDDSSATSRRRASAAYRASCEGPIEVGGGAASESGTDEFSSTDGDDTFTSTMLKLLTATTEGRDDIIVIDIYDLLRRAHLDDLLLDSLRAGCRLDGDEKPVGPFGHQCSIYSPNKFFSLFGLNCGSG